MNKIDNLSIFNEAFILLDLMNNGDDKIAPPQKKGLTSVSVNYDSLWLCETLQQAY